MPIPRAAAILPARYTSVRLPGKPLLSETGLPLIVHVLERVRLATAFDRVIVATDDDRIRKAVEHHGGEAWMTSPDHPTGTDRIAEVARQLPHPIVVNVQGDEPEIDPDLLDELVRALESEPEIPLATAASPLTGPEQLHDSDSVKVVLDRRGRALYFSRAPIPHIRNRSAANPLLHIGVYAYRREFLLQFPELSQTPLEQTECLEQLRCLEHGFPIRVIQVPLGPGGIDTPEDYQRFVERFRTG